MLLWQIYDTGNNWTYFSHHVVRSDFNQIWILLTDLYKHPQYLNFMEIQPAGAVVIHMDRQT